MRTMFVLIQSSIRSNHPYHKISGGNYEYFIGMDMGNIIQNVEKVDDYTVKINLKVPNAPFLANIAMDFASIFLCRICG
ncbi:dipeptide transport protein [Actinobacillus pleuropneumoniae]|nr:dipeptide transport protein [Actinobacillus pleuropneumoniae]